MKPVLKLHPFGMSPENPIPTRGVTEEYDYVSHLVGESGETLKPVGQELLCHTDGRRVDKLILVRSNGGELALYFDFQSDQSSRQAPAGFRYVR